MQGWKSFDCFLCVCFVVFEMKSFKEFCSYGLLFSGAVNRGGIGPVEAHF